MTAPLLPRLGSIVLLVATTAVAAPSVSIAQPAADSDPTVEPSSWWSGPYETGISTTYLSGSGAREVRIHLARTIPLTIGSPRGALQSRVHLVPTRAGIRTGLGEGRSFRGSVALLDGDLYRAPIAAGLTVLEYGRAGRFREESRWLDLRAGLSARSSAGRLAVEPRLVGSIGLTSIRPGRVGWALGPPAADRTTGLDLGVRTDLPVRIEGVGFLAAAGSIRTVKGSSDLIERWLGAELGIALTDGLEWRTRLRWSDLSGPIHSDAHLFARTGLHLRIR